MNPFNIDIIEVSINLKMEIEGLQSQDILKNTFKLSSFLLLLNFLQNL